MVGGFQDEDDAMKCVICKHGDTAPGTATVTLERSGTIAVIRNVPAEVCQDCGEYYLDEATSKRVMAQAEAAAARNVEVEVASYAA
jgi:YgiT-type zinc finger domain-containing protein